MTTASHETQAARFLRGTRLFASLMGLVAVLAPGAAEGAVLNPEEQEFANLMVNAAGQRRNRALMKPDARLVSVARARARDMANRDYFDHVNPDGNAVNILVRNTGYPLPAFYTSSRSLNYMESIAGGTATAQSAWSSLLSSGPHKRHLLAEDSFYREQTTFGIGHYYSPGSRYQHYWVIITAPPAGPAGLAITSPSAGARVTRESITVAGTSAGTDHVGAIEFRLENAAGIGAWKNAAVPAGDGGSWSGALDGFIPGSNTVRVRTLDASGAGMQEESRTFRWVVLKPLIVSVAGPGGVTDGFLGTTNHEVGVAFSIKAEPAAGAILDHWEGLPDSPGRDPLALRQTLVMEEGLALLAVFVPSPYVALKGGYQGLIGADGAGADGMGFLAIRLTGSGVFTGSLKLGGAVFSLKGRFNSRGDAQISIPRAGLAALELALHMDLAGGLEEITGTLVNGGDSQAVSLARGVPPEAAGVYAAGRQTLRIAPDAAEPQSPQGHGYSTVNITAAGRALVQGAMADGRPFSSSSLVGRDGSFSMYVPLRGGAGAITGRMQILSGADAGLDGALRWMNPERVDAPRYAAPFASSHTVNGSPYTAPAPGEPCVQLSPGANVGELTLAGGEIQQALQQRVLVDGQNQVSLAGPATAGLSMRVNPLNGRISGSFDHPTAGRRPFSGVVLQKQNGAWGYFLGTEAAGNAELLPVAE